MFEDSKWCNGCFLDNPAMSIFPQFRAVHQFWPLCGAICLQAERTRAEFEQVKAEAWNFPALNLGKEGQEGFKKPPV